MRQYAAFKASSFYTARGLVPFRTELSVGFRLNNVNICAGQIDIIYQATKSPYEGQYFLIDFKRVQVTHSLDPDERGYVDWMGRERMGKCGMEALPDTAFTRYSLQTAAYAVMLRTTHKLNVGPRMYLLRLHSDREAFELIKCRDLRSEAREMLQIEYNRIQAQS